jgi:hypothetical protein
VTFDPALILALAGIFVGGLARGFMGFGAALVIMPALILAYGPVPAVVILSLMEVPGTLQLLPTALREANWRALAPLAIAAIIALPLGAWMLVVVEADVLRRSIAVVVLVFAGLIAMGWRYGGAPRLPLTIGIGSVSGFFSGAANLGGPPVVLFLLANNSGAAGTRAGIMAYFSVVMVARLSMFGVYGLYNTEIVARSLTLVPVYILAIWLGSRLFRDVSEVLFRRLVLALVLVMSLIALFA